MTVMAGLHVVDDTDERLVSRAAGGDHAAFGRLMVRYRPRFARYACHMLGNVADAEEVLQESFIRAWRSLPRCAHPDRFDAWLFQIVANRCRTALARRRRRNEVALPAPETAVLVDGAPAPPERTAWREEISRALARLPVEQREAFLLKHVEELSYDEMAALTGAGTSALKMRVKRACEALRRSLGEVYSG